jgi:prolyl-tRNA synthetase
MHRFDRLSKALLITSKEIDTSKTISHDLLLRGGFIKQSSQGMYSLLPFGLRVLEKIEKLIDSELSQISNKISMPCLLPAKHWKKTKRFETSETFKVQDRKKADFLLAPTHEEEVTTLIGSMITSYRQLPLSVYQIGNRNLYRKEIS